MPNIKSAKKRVLVSAKKTEENKIIRSAVRTEIKKVEALVANGKYQEAKDALSDAFSIIDSACSKNIIKKNNAANKKARLSAKVDASLKASPVQEEPVKKVEEVKVEENPVETVEAEPAKKVRKPRAKKLPIDGTL